MGVSVSEMASDIKMATASVMANSRKSRPITSLMNSSGISTAISDKVSDTRVKPIWAAPLSAARIAVSPSRSEEHTSELQSLMRISYAVFCLKKNNRINHVTHIMYTDYIKNSINH